MCAAVEGKSLIQLCGGAYESKCGATATTDADHAGNYRVAIFVSTSVSKI